MVVDLDGHGLRAEPGEPELAPHATKPSSPLATAAPAAPCASLEAPGLCDALCESTVSKVKELRLFYNQIGPNGAKAIAALCAVRASLTKISLARNKLEEEGTKVICEALKGNETLKELDLSGDHFLGSNIGGPAGAKHVADMLSAMASLTTVCASRETTRIFPQAALLSDSLTRSLQVNLSGNRLCGIWTEGFSLHQQKGTYTAEGIKAIANALRVSASLTSVSCTAQSPCNSQSPFFLEPRVPPSPCLLLSALAAEPFRKLFVQRGPEHCSGQGGRLILSCRGSWLPAWRSSSANQRQQSGLQRSSWRSQSFC